MTRKGPKQNKSSSGFTLLEIVIAMGVSSVVILGAGYAFLMAKKQQGAIEKSLASVSDQVLLERVIHGDMEKTAPAFGVLNDPFFDYLADTSCNPNQAGCSRAYTLLPGNEFWFLMADEGGMSNPTPFDPVKVYGPDNKFSGALLRTYLSNTDVFGKLWNKYQKVLFYCPVPLRPDPNSMPRFLSFTGQVASDTTAFLTANPSIKNTAGKTVPALTLTDPTSNDKLKDLDQYLRHLVPVGGINTFVMVRPILLARYKIDSKGNFYRAIMTDATHPNDLSETMVTRNVKKVEFTRDTVATVIVRFKIFLNTISGK